jgi:hypothetical protein
MEIKIGQLAYTYMRANLGDDVESGLRMALLHYAKLAELGKGPIDVPPFSRKSLPPEAGFTIDLTWDERTEALLKEEAARQGVTMDVLATHAVLVYLAALERG